MINKITIIGNVGKDVDMKIFESGSKVARFTVATTERYKNKNGEKVEETTWHNVGIYGKMAETAEKWIKKGGQVYIEGMQTHRSYESGGDKKFFSEIKSFEFKLLGRKGEGQSEQSAKQTETPKPANTQQGVDDDLPF